MAAPVDPEALAVILRKLNTTITAAQNQAASVGVKLATVDQAVQNVANQQQTLRRQLSRLESTTLRDLKDEVERHFRAELGALRSAIDARTATAAPVRAPADGVADTSDAKVSSDLDSAIRELRLTTPSVTEFSLLEAELSQCARSTDLAQCVSQLTSLMSEIRDLPAVKEFVGYRAPRPELTESTSNTDAPLTLAQALEPRFATKLDLETTLASAKAFTHTVIRAGCPSLDTFKEFDFATKNRKTDQRLTRLEESLSQQLEQATTENDRLRKEVHRLRHELRDYTDETVKESAATMKSKLVSMKMEIESEMESRINAESAEIERRLRAEFEFKYGSGKDEATGNHERRNSLKEQIASRRRSLV